MLAEQNEKKSIWRQFLYVMAFVVMLLASAGGLAGTYVYKRRKMKKS